MAVFNPQIQPTQDPNYLNYARVLDAPTPDLSGKVLLDTAASTLDTAATVTDQAIKKGISDRAYANVDPERDKFTKGLEQVKADLNRGAIPQPTGQKVASGNWLDANAMADPEDNLPVGLSDSVNGVQALAAAKAAGSPKLNDTSYALAVLNKAQQDRTFYGPAYREYIDQKYSEASGLPIANSYYNNMLLDINRQMAQMGRVKDDIGSSLAKSNDMPGQADLLLRYKADPNNKELQSEVLHRVNEWENLKSSIPLDAAKRAAAKDKKTDIADDQSASLTRILNGHVSINMSALKSASLPGGGTGKDLLQFFDDFSSGRLPNVSEAEVNQRRVQFNNFVKRVQSEADSIAGGYVDTIGPDEADKRVKSAMAPLLAQQKFINNKEDGPAFFITNQIEHIKADSTHNTLINKDFGKEAAAIMGARAIFGEQYMPQWLTDMASTGVINKFKGIVSQEGLAAVAPYTDTRGDPIPRYHIDAIKHGKEIGATGDDKYYGELGVTKVVTMISDPNMNLRAKEKLIDYAFNPKNIGRLNELKMDYRDPNSGQMVEGKYRMFNILASEGINKGVRETSLIHPENYEVYRKTLETEFGGLYRSTLKDLNKLVSEDKSYLGLHFSYNDKTHQFGLVDKNDRPIQEDPRVANADRIPAIQNPNVRYISAMLDKLALVNSGVTNMARVHANDPKTPGDTDKYLLQLTQTAGFRPGSNIAGATEGMAKAIIKSKNPEMTPQELDKRLLGSQGPALRSNFTPEEDNSLASFLRSPAGRRGENLEPYQTRGVIRGNLSDEKLVGVQSDEIPAGMSARDFIKMLKAGKKLGGNVD